MKLPVWINSILFFLLVCTSPALSAPDEYLGSGTCQQCHAKEYREWKQSHHQHAMQEASLENILGDFSQSQRVIAGKAIKFHVNQGTYAISIDDQRYTLLFTFGFFPLQQYLVKMKGGALHALPLAWDSRPKEQGGQRWFMLPSGNTARASDPLHWTQITSNANTMCIECHTTGYKKNYSTQQSSYTSSWSELSVGCEACHGSAKRHMKEAKSQQWSIHKGFINSLSSSWQPQEWKFQKNSSIATRKNSKLEHREIETCATCHSRRLPLDKRFTHGQHFLDAFAPTLVTPPFYEESGRVREETFVYGSYLQSKMYLAGVTCSDCHNPHTLQLRAKGNSLCAQCHNTEVFDTPSHYQEEGKTCVECHMPLNTFMGIDDRRDHSFRFPQALRHNQPQNDLMNLALDIRNETTPPILRGSYLVRALPFLKESAETLVEQAAHSSHDLIRYAAAQVLSYLEQPERTRLGLLLIQDKLRAVRVLAARELAGTEIPEAKQDLVLSRIEEYRASLLALAELPSSQVSLGILETKLNNTNHAIEHYKRALELNKHTVAAYINWADILRIQKKEREAKRVLLEGLKYEVDDPDLNLSLGLLLGRQQLYKEAAKYLETTLERRPQDLRAKQALAFCKQQAH